MRMEFLPVWARTGLCAAVGAALCAACSTLSGPAYQRPAAPEQTGWAFGSNAVSGAAVVTTN